MHIRKMTEVDREQVLVFYASDAVLSNGSEEIFNNDITACVSDDPYAEGFMFVVDRSDSIPAGYAMIARSYSTEFGRYCIWVEDLYLSEHARGLGLASEFFDYIRNEYPGHVFRLEVEEENEHAVEVYRHKGFRDLPYKELIIL